MKRGTTEHPKMMMLASVLGISKWGAVGIMESVWHFAAKYAPQGDIGKYSDEMVAAGIGWQDDPKTLISALIDCKWLDKSGQVRLIVHDWSDHSDDYADKHLARHGLLYADGKEPRRKAAYSGKKRMVGGKGRTRAEKSRGSVSVSVSESVSPPNPQEGDFREGDRADFLSDWVQVQEALLGTGKCDGLTREMLATAFRGVTIGPAEIDELRLSAEGMVGQVGSLMHWLRKRAQELGKKECGGDVVGSGSRLAPVDDDARKANFRAVVAKIGGAV